MALHNNSLKTLLSCSVCSVPFSHTIIGRHARTLPCGDNICHQCLESLSRHIPFACPGASKAREEHQQSKVSEQAVSKSTPPRTDHQQQPHGQFFVYNVTAIPRNMAIEQVADIVMSSSSLILQLQEESTFAGAGAGGKTDGSSSSRASAALLASAQQQLAGTSANLEAEVVKEKNVSTIRDTKVSDSKLHSQEASTVSSSTTMDASSSSRRRSSKVTDAIDVETADPILSALIAYAAKLFVEDGFKPNTALTGTFNKWSSYAVNSRVWPPKTLAEGSTTSSSSIVSRPSFRDYMQKFEPLGVLSIATDPTQPFSPILTFSTASILRKLKRDGKVELPPKWEHLASIAVGNRTGLETGESSTRPTPSTQPAAAATTTTAALGRPVVTTSYSAALSAPAQPTPPTGAPVPVKTGWQLAEETGEETSDPILSALIANAAQLFVQDGFKVNPALTGPFSKWSSFVANARVWPPRGIEALYGGTSRVSFRQYLQKFEGKGLLTISQDPEVSTGRLLNLNVGPILRKLKRDGGSIELPPKWEHLASIALGSGGNAAAAAAADGGGDGAGHQGESSNTSSSTSTSTSTSASLASSLASSLPIPPQSSSRTFPQEISEETTDSVLSSLIAFAAKLFVEDGFKVSPALSGPFNKWTYHLTISARVWPPKLAEGATSHRTFRDYLKKYEKLGLVTVSPDPTEATGRVLSLNLGPVLRKIKRDRNVELPPKWEHLATVALNPNDPPLLVSSNNNTSNNNSKISPTRLVASAALNTAAQLSATNGGDPVLIGLAKAAVMQYKKLGVPGLTQGASRWGQMLIDLKAWPPTAPPPLVVSSTGTPVQPIAPRFLAYLMEHGNHLVLKSNPRENKEAEIKVRVEYVYRWLRELGVEKTTTQISSSSTAAVASTSTTSTSGSTTYRKSIFHLLDPVIKLLISYASERCSRKGLDEGISAPLNEWWEMLGNPDLKQAVAVATGGRSTKLELLHDDAFQRVRSQLSVFTTHMYVQQVRDVYILTWDSAICSTSPLLQFNKEWMLDHLQQKKRKKEEKQTVTTILSRKDAISRSISGESSNSNDGDGGGSGSIGDDTSALRSSTSSSGRMLEEETSASTSLRESSSNSSSTTTTNGSENKKKNGTSLVYETREENNDRDGGDTQDIIFSKNVTNSPARMDHVLIKPLGGITPSSSSHLHQEGVSALGLFHAHHTMHDEIPSSPSSLLSRLNNHPSGNSAYHAHHGADVFGISGGAGAAVAAAAESLHEDFDDTTFEYASALGSHDFGGGTEGGITGGGVGGGREITGSSFLLLNAYNNSSSSSSSTGAAAAAGMGLLLPRKQASGEDEAFSSTSSLGSFDTGDAFSDVVSKMLGIQK